MTGGRTFLVQPERAKTGLFVKMDTDAGLHGWGEVFTSGAHERSLES